MQLLRAGAIADKIVEKLSLNLMRVAQAALFLLMMMVAIDVIGRYIFWITYFRCLGDY